MSPPPPCRVRFHGARGARPCSRWDSRESTLVLRRATVSGHMGLIKGAEAPGGATDPRAPATPPNNLLRAGRPPHPPRVGGPRRGRSTRTAAGRSRLGRSSARGRPPPPAAGRLDDGLAHWAALGERGGDGRPWQREPPLRTPRHDATLYACGPSVRGWGAPARLDAGWEARWDGARGREPAGGRQG